MPISSSCCICKKIVKNNHRALKCDICRNWIHKSAINYHQQILNDDEKWFCIKCLDDTVPFCSLNPKTLKNFLDGKNEEFNLSIENKNRDTDDYIFPVRSKYYDITEFTKLNIQNNFLSVFHLNINSLHSHYEELINFVGVCKHDFKFIALSESNLNKDRKHSCFSIPGYNYEHTLTESVRGGTLLYISNQYSYKKRNDLDFYKRKELESTFVGIIGCIYRHPCRNISEFNFAYLSPLLENLSLENKDVILLGDFNINLLKADNDSSVQEFLDHMSSNFLFP